MPADLPTIVLVGRTNVGKSTLFNRLLESKKALVSAEAGTTRDRLEGECIWRGQAVKVVDTGGLDVNHQDEIERNIAKQAERAMETADLIVFVVSLKEGLLPQEIELAKRLGEAGKPVVVAGNKAESPADVASASSGDWQFQNLPAPVPISALRGTGVGDLLDAIYDGLEGVGKPPGPISDIDAVKIAVIGKPNVGKSSLLNALIGDERFIASPVAHTTREPNDVLLERDGKRYLLIDTAGVRKRGKVRRAGGLEASGVERTRRMIREADIALMVTDAADKIGTQDRVLAGLLEDARTGMILIANKWDLIPDKAPNTINRFQENVADAFPFLRWAPIVTVSAKTGQRVDRILGTVDRVAENRKRRIPRKQLQEFWREAVRKHRPTRGKGPVPPQILTVEQSGVEPPTFNVVITAKQRDVLAKSYLRYLENQLREAFDFEGTPIRMHVRLPRTRAK